MCVHLWSCAEKTADGSEVKLAEILDVDHASVRKTKKSSTFPYLVNWPIKPINDSIPAHEGFRSIITPVSEIKLNSTCNKSIKRFIHISLIS